jgi:hypothetical protein
MMAKRLGILRRCSKRADRLLDDQESQDDHVFSPWDWRCDAGAEPKPRDEEPRPKKGFLQLYPDPRADDRSEPL